MEERQKYFLLSLLSLLSLKIIRPPSPQKENRIRPESLILLIIP